MKKNYFSFLIVALMLLVAMPVSAQVKSVKDFFGKWQFTADVEVKNDSYADLVSSSCEVVITKGGDYAATISNFAGATTVVKISSFDADTQTLLFLNPNTPQLWSPLFMADGDGKYPYGTAEGGWRDSYGSIEFTYDPATGILSYPDFTLVTADHNAGTTEVMVKVSNIKMTLIEAEEFVIPEIAGEWKYTPYYSRNDSTFVEQFTMNLVATDDTNENWNVTFSFEGFEEFTLPGTFDGINLDIPFDSLYLDAENKIRFGVKATSSTPENVFKKDGKFSFAYSTKTMMWQNDYIYIRQEGVDTLGNEVAPLVQQLWGGWIQREDPNAYKWDGTYEVSVKYLEDYDDTDSIEFPKNFDMVVVESNGSYVIKSFLGYDCSLGLTANEDGQSATIDLKGGYGFAYVKYLGEIDGDYAYYSLTDVNGQSTSLTVTLNEDGSLSIDDFSVCYYLWVAGTSKCLASMSKVSASKFEFDWAGEYTLTATVEAEDATAEFPAVFDVVVEATENGYVFKQFMNADVYSLNQGAMTLNTDGKNAAIALNGAWGYCFVAGSYPDYTILTDNEGKSTSLNVVYSNGALTMDDFGVYAFNWDTNESSKLATYSNVVLTKKSEDNAIEKNVVENNTVEGIFDLLGRKHDAITAPGLYIVNGKKVFVK